MHILKKVFAMYEYIKGDLSEASPTRAVVEASGVGFSLHIPLSSYPKLPSPGSQILFFVSLVIRQEMHTLYGFLTRMERDLFESLTQVSGIGPKTALALIGHLDAGDLQLAVSQSNITLLCRVPGIGKKTAERLVVDLRDKFAKQALIDPSLGEGSTFSKDAYNALINLGYPPIQAQKAIKMARSQGGEELSLPQLITAALRCL
jgi:holliday junction DNA helicase RuvA